MIVPRLAIATAATIFISSSCAWADNRTTLPALLGPYPVSITNHEVKTDRWDPLAPTVEKRRLMITVFKPLTGLSSCPDITYLPYMSDAARTTWDQYLSKNLGLPNDTLTRVRIQNCNASTSSATAYEDAPLLIFSPGSGAPRFIYDSFNQAIASSGYTVITVDHPYDSLIVEFPDGSTSLRNTVWDIINNTAPGGLDASSSPFISVRAADMTTVLDAVQHGRISGLEPYAQRRPLKAIAYGQSLGGNSAVAAVEQDTRFIGVMDWDSNMWDPQVRNTNISIPVALLASGQRWFTGNLNQTWPQFFTHLEGWNVAFGVNGTEHITNTDVPLIADTLGLRTAKFNSAFGNLPGREVQKIDVSYSVSFFDYVFKGKKPTLLQGSTSQFPEVFFIRGPIE